MSGDRTHEEPTETPPAPPQAESAAAREDSVLALAEPPPGASAHQGRPDHDDAYEMDAPGPDPADAHIRSPEQIQGLSAASAEQTDVPPVVGSIHAPTAADAPDEAASRATPIEVPEEEDEVTTLLPAPADMADEPTTIVLASTHEEEVTTFLPVSPGHEVDEATTLVLSDASEEDEATTLLASPEYDADEATTLVHAGQDEQAYEPSSIGPATEPLQAEPALPARMQPALEQHSPEHDEGVTEIRPACLPGPAQGEPDWFAASLQQFTQTLRHDEAGAARPPQDVQQLALAARDMIARVAMQGGPRTAAEGWTGDTVLQPDQLLANTYIVRSLIARGGIGEIYRTRHRDLKTEHAVKVLLPRYALDPTVLSLLQDEARLLACVRHEAVVRCQDLLRDADGRPMLVMDFLRGRTLSARLREGRLATPELIVLARRLAEGLIAIHAAGIIHQDISPDNVILADDSCGAATIIDFGLARRVGTGRDMHRNLDFAGKYSWSSPEQLSGRPAAVDARSDLYSLGLMLAAAARGYRLDMGQDLESARAARTTVPSLAGIEQPLAGLIEALLAPAPDARLGSASDIEAMLEPKPRSWWARIAPYLGLSASL